MLAGALIVAGTERRPTGQVSVAREIAHVHAELGDEHFVRALIDPGDRVQLRQVLGERGEPALDFLAHRIDRPAGTGASCEMNTISLMRARKRTFAMYSAWPPGAL